MNNETDWVIIRVYKFPTIKFDWNYIEPSRISLWEKILRWAGVVDIIRMNTKTNEVKLD